MNGRLVAAVGLLAVVVVIVIAALGGGTASDATPSARAVEATTSTTSAAPSPTEEAAPSTTDAPAATAPPAPPTPPTPPTSASTADTAPDTPGAPDLPDRGVHPALRSIDGWLQSDVTSLEELRGQVVAVQFWTFGCSNCKATLPHLQQLYADHHDQGFEIVGIHAPEFSYEADVDNIVDAARDLGVTWPLALDTEKRTFHFWQEGTRAFWPRIYLLDRDGHIRYDHIGEGRYDEIDAAVRALLAEPIR